MLLGIRAVYPCELKQTTNAFYIIRDSISYMYMARVAIKILSFTVIRVENENSTSRRRNKINRKKYKTHFLIALFCMQISTHKIHRNKT